MKQYIQQIQEKRNNSKKELLPYKEEVPKGIDFKKYRVASPSELFVEPIGNKKQATSTYLDKIRNSVGFACITMER